MSPYAVFRVTWKVGNTQSVSSRVLQAETHPVCDFPSHTYPFITPSRQKILSCVLRCSGPSNYLSSKYGDVMQELKMILTPGLPVFQKHKVNKIKHRI